MITAGRLAIAFDCALECDVPPEATQVYLSDELHAVMTEGPGLYVSDVRDNLAERIRGLLESSESRAMKSVLLDGVSASSPEVAGAYIHLIAKMGQYTNCNAEFLDVLSDAFKRDNHAVRLSLINAMRDLPALRRTENLKILGHVLERGGVVERTAAIQLLEEEPTLITSFPRPTDRDTVSRQCALSHCRELHSPFRNLPSERRHRPQPSRPRSSNLHVQRWTKTSAFRKVHHFVR